LLVVTAASNKARVEPWREMSWAHLTGRDRPSQPGVLEEPVELAGDVADRQICSGW
jgi:hypothetical protein